MKLQQNLNHYWKTLKRKESINNVRQPRDKITDCEYTKYSENHQGYGNGCCEQNEESTRSDDKG